MVFVKKCSKTKFKQKSGKQIIHSVTTPKVKPHCVSSKLPSCIIENASISLNNRFQVLRDLNAEDNSVFFMGSLCNTRSSSDEFYNDKFITNTESNTFT